MMTEEAKRAQREYMKQYRKRNREKVNELNRKWRQENPDKVREYNQRYWERKAKQMANE
ncbi:hypothetical protein ABID56_002617 [Alkalibacillus flavidus]|uniref:Uncharacterized protein n=1 Tax=Alkalibacillus flavidus TaxID=546021 RepID=A0ABV2L0L7_9BACI